MYGAARACHWEPYQVLGMAVIMAVLWKPMGILTRV